MFIEAYNNISINLANVSIMAVYQSGSGKLGEKLFDVQFDEKALHIPVEQSQVDFYKNEIEKFNASGRGAFFWLFSNICVNADVVTSVARHGSVLHVRYDDKEWTSDGKCTEETARRLYDGFTAFAREREKTLAERFAAATKVVPESEEPAPEKLPEPPPPAPVVYTESKGLSKIRKF